ncbi:MAG: deoxyribodipyrimidine photo-lyase [Gammaproteobacteria bacterium]|nr:deoxyribodipyrimidine photo-lyase [Gammaproteobacteria bacterium]
MNLVWFRNDLRLDDNPALYKACQQSDSVKAVFIATPAQWSSHHDAPVKLALMHAALQNLAGNLAQLGITFDLLEAETFDDCPQLLEVFCNHHGITRVWFNREYPLNEIKRDQQVIHLLQKSGIETFSQTSDLIVPEPLSNQQGEYYKVFTPWYKAWMKQVSSSPVRVLSSPKAVGPALKVKPIPIFGDQSAYRRDLWPADEEKAQQMLMDFIQKRSDHYDEHRDIPSINGTSTASPYLATGILSVRRCLFEIQQHCDLKGADWRENAWARELGWREFYRNLIIGFPKLSRGEPFKAETQAIVWEYDQSQINAWKNGLTGYPIIDAAMRQLQRTGWMHNRLRMLSASFFNKLMLHDWHIGETYFMENLIDGDFASNNGGWQWSASTGCDASPWFRIFNPTRQSEKFDPEGTFIRKMVPELSSLDNRHIHDPTPDQRERLAYPLPVLDYKSARERVLDRFKTCLKPG